MSVTVFGDVRPFIKQQVGRRQFFTSGTVRFMLVMPSRSGNVAKHKATGQPAMVHVDVDIRFDGTFKAQVERNDHITPAGTMYSVMFMAPNLNQVPMHYIFEGEGPFNLNAMSPMSVHESRDRHAQEIRERIVDLQRQLKDVEES